MRRGKMFAAALVSGLICACCVMAYLTSVRTEIELQRAEVLERYGGEQIEVYVANRDIAAGETLSSASIETQLWVADLLPGGAVRDADEVIGKTVSSAILEGEVVNSRRFQSDEASFEIPDGYIALSVSAKEVQAVGGAVSAGSRVDVYATGNSGTALLESDVLVIATNASMASEGIEAEVSWITLALLPERVQELVAATQTSTLYFALPSSSLAAPEILDEGVVDDETALDGFGNTEAKDLHDVAENVRDETGETSESGENADSNENDEEGAFSEEKQ